MSQEQANQEPVQSPSISAYFESIDNELQRAYKIAGEARKKGFDPEDKIDIPIAKNMAERVIGLVSTLSPQLLDTTIVSRIVELEEEFGRLDWRVGFKISEEIAKENFCQFSSKKEAMEVAIRVGFAYLTLGIVSAPLEGFIGLDIKRRRDGKGEYFSIHYAGPIRGAGGTAAAVSVILADYVRVKMGYAAYDPSEEEIARYTTEITDYHERCVNLQYFPSEEELKFFTSHLPIEVNGDPTEKFEVSNHKDLPRVETNRIRGGLCLVIAEGLCQKSPKIWKRLINWGKEFELEHWNFLEEFLSLQKKVKAQTKSGDESTEKITPNFTFIKDMVAGRPVLTHPLADGGFRLRYGRGRTSGFSATCTHPATMGVLDNFIAVGTQLKIERPGKATSITVSESLEGPIVLLEDGSVVAPRTPQEVKAVTKNVQEILFLGDILISYGDFSENNHKLVPAGYCEEWWVLDLKKAVKSKGGIDVVCGEVGISTERLNILLTNYFTQKPTFEEAFIFSKKLQVALHPSFTYFYNSINSDQFISLLEWFRMADIEKEEGQVKKIILPYNQSLEKPKRFLELIGVPHQVITKEYVVIEKNHAKSLYLLFAESIDITLSLVESNKELSTLDIINKIVSVSIKDKAGTFIGARMGRPEKAKMRKLTGSPHVLFPVGKEGDRFRSFNAAISTKQVTADFSLFHCTSCNTQTVYRQCERCGEKCSQTFHCRTCGQLEQECEHGAYKHQHRSIDINHYVDSAKKMLDMRVIPDLIKGVRGTSNRDHVVEHFSKGLLRSKHGIYVNKDGTTRYDMTELPITHFTPAEIGASIEKIQSLGYDKDAFGEDLTDPLQVVELKPQDIILPSNQNAFDESANKVLLRVAKFIDELLEKLYGLPPYYNCKKDEDLIGHLVIGLAPHISAGLIGRIIGFSQTQGCYAHPLWHAGLRRDCLSYDSFIQLFDGKIWTIQKIGDFVEKVNPQRVVDSFGTQAKKLKNYSTFAFNKKTGKMELSPIIEVTKHKPSSMVKVVAENGRELTVTSDHKFIIESNGKKILKEARLLTQKDKVITPLSLDISENDITYFDLIDIFKDNKNLMIRKISLNIKKQIKKRKEFREKFEMQKYELDNYLARDSFPFKLIEKIKGASFRSSTLKTALRRDNVSLPWKIKIDKKFLYLIGLYIAEGNARINNSKKGFAQIQFAATEEEIRKKVISYMGNVFGLSPSRITDAAIIYSSKLLYFFFVNELGLAKKAQEKRIPSQFLNLHKKKINYLLQGYFDGDGSTDSKELRVSCDSVSKGLLQDLCFILARFGIYARLYTYTKKPGPIVRAFYERKNRVIPKFTNNKLTIPSNFCQIFAKKIGFSLKRKQKVLLENIRKRKITGTKIHHDNKFAYLRVKEVISLKKKETTYCINVDKNHNFMANGIIVKNCDGDEAAVMLLMDALLNFSRQYLPDRRGAKTMDAPLVLTAKINAAEVDDQVHGLDVAWQYPLELYEAASLYKDPWEVKVEQLKNRLGTPGEIEGVGYTHPISSINNGILYSAYKSLPSMAEKLKGQMGLATKIRAVNTTDVSRLVIERHFMKDLKGNMRKFSQQQFRCVKCNTKFRRPPLVGKCTKCNDRIIFTISYGSIVKYLEPSINLATNYDVSPYLKQTLELLQDRIESVFGREKEKQVGLGEWA